MASAIWQKRRRRRDDESIVKHMVGNAMVLHAPDSISAEAQSLALAVTEDADNDVVVLDLGEGLAIDSWESMANVLPRRRRGIRLMACGRHRDSAAMAGQWLSERLNRTVIAPDGDLVRGAGGALLVHSSRRSGWVRFRPGRPPSWDAKRYPAPVWDGAVIENRATSATAGIQPLPGGVWIHDTQSPQIIAQHRRQLIDDVPCDPETMTVLLGCPGTPPLSLDDVVRFWRELEPDVQARARFVQYGEVRLPEGEALGQALADLFGTSVICYTGVPVGTQRERQVRTVRADGTRGWPPFAIELGYTPRAHENSRAARPVILSHRPPLRWTEEIDPRVYWYAPDAVVEVVEAGLWVRAVDEPGNAERVRAATLDPSGVSLIFDDSEPKRVDRLRGLAVDLAARLPEREGGTLVAASVLTPGSKSAGRADATLDVTPIAALNGVPVEIEAAPAVEAPPAVAVAAVVESPAVEPLSERTLALRMPAASPPIGEPRPARGVASIDRVDQPVPPPPTAFLRPAASVPPPPAAFMLPVPPTVPPVVPPPPAAFDAPPPPVEPPALPPPAAIEAPTPDVEPPALPPPAIEAPTLDVEPPALPPPAAFVPPAPAVVPPALPPPAVDPAPAVAPPSMPTGVVLPVDVETAADMPAPVRSAEATEPPTESAPEETPPRSTAVRVQPVPTASASALLPSRPLDEERGWLRRTLSREFDHMASSVSRIISEHPGLQAGGTPAGDLLADSVAVRLYLTRRGERVNAALRTGVAGPHVPFARCVVAGLSRLPSFRGSTMFRISPDEREWALYRGRKLVTDWSLVNALTRPHEGQEGDTDLLIWSMTARRTALLEPEGEDRIEDRVLFLPGTSFKILEMRPPADGQRGAILLREIGTNEIDADGRLHQNGASLDELANTALHRSLERWGTPSPSPVTATTRGCFRVLPGLDGEGEGR
ncbi:hypothetical protein V6W11_11695 [Micromonospora profundi]|uniref:hypothetical protein n=1 Tax=Micromonospora profundi TaxID=1420889 RepID=UPI002FF145B1